MSLFSPSIKFHELYLSPVTSQIDFALLQNETNGIVLCIRPTNGDIYYVFINVQLCDVQFLFHDNIYKLLKFINTNQNLQFQNIIIRLVQGQSVNSKLTTPVTRYVYCVRACGIRRGLQTKRSESK